MVLLTNVALYFNFLLFILGACLVVDPKKRSSVDAIIAQLYPKADKLGENFDHPPVSVM